MPFRSQAEVIAFTLEHFSPQIYPIPTWLMCEGRKLHSRQEWASHKVCKKGQLSEETFLVCVCVLDLHEGAHGGQSAGVHHAGLAAIRRLQQRRPPQPARVLHSLPWVTSLCSSRCDIQSSKAGDLSSKSVLEPVLQPRINTWLPSSLSAQAHD